MRLLFDVVGSGRLMAAAFSLVVVSRVSLMGVGMWSPGPRSPGWMRFW